MGKSLLFVITVLLVLTQAVASAQYCTAVGPSSAADSNIQNVQLTGEGGTEINFVGCPGVIGFDDQTANQSVDLAIGDSYTAYMVFGTCGGNYYGVGEAWIDFNMNGVFEASESIGTWAGTPPTSPEIMNFTVPSGATAGTTRMRVVHYEGGSLPINPCATFTWGSTTDFTVNLGGGIDCSTYIGDSMSVARPVNSIPFQEDHSNAVCYTNNVTVYNSPDVFYRLIPANYGASHLNISLCTSAFDTYLSVMDKDTNIIAYNDDYGPCSPQSELTIAIAEYDTLYVVVQGWNNQKGDYTIAINDAATTSLMAQSEINIEIYPNPTNGLFYIDGISQEDKIELINPAGQLISVDCSVDGKKTVINCENYEPGIYFVRIVDKNFIGKIIIK